MHEIAFSLSTVIVLISGILGLAAGWYATIRKTDRLETALKLLVSKDELQKMKDDIKAAHNGMKRDFQAGIKEMSEVYHELDAKERELDVIVKFLQEKA